MNSDKVGRIPPPTKRVVVRKANSHRDLRPLTERATLEKVLGLTVSKNAALACDPLSGVVAYPAGCVVVLFNPRKNKQSFVLNTSKKTISSLAFSGDGKYLATGESGHMPSVRIWDMEDPSHPQIAEMTKGHKFGVACMAGTKVASNKVSSKVSALSFSENGSYFVTVGVRHVKFWYFDTESNKSKLSKTLVISGRAALLGEQRNNKFCDVACGRGLNSDVTYCVTSSGLLCSINSKRVLDTWVELKTSKANAIVVSEEFIVCGCADGIIRVFNPLKLQHIVTLPKPHFLGVNIAAGMDLSNPLSKAENAAYPDTVAVALDMVNQRLTCVYNDHSLYTWNVKDMKKIGKTWSSLYHSTCVWGVEVYPNLSDSHEAALPPGSFLTCSSDDTIRVWNIEEGESLVTMLKMEMMKIIYTGETVENLKETDVSPGHKLLASAGRDRLIHIFDVQNNFSFVQTLDDHSASITSVKFNMSESDELQLLSCGADKSIIFRTAQQNPDLQKHAATACQDRNVRVYDVITGKQTKCYKGTSGDDGTLVKITLDSSGTYAATSCSDKSVCITEFDTGECVASMSGHSEVVTGMKFTVDCKNLISVGGDG
ncbi:Mitogen-activated protein kinase-binding protein 1 [Acropora cervicornis]|uniref:Mitogen-activated protein kinase-binding protein 1 n=1 Tax=Acropora cervicornis TaxID=6130 RepID=A0AAD9QGU7_ACRCE|nr:Mitogen-activated protein kinase-binding protein 1 [Acropora cervicornis]